MDGWVQGGGMERLGRGSFFLCVRMGEGKEEGRKEEKKKKNGKGKEAGG